MKTEDGSDCQVDIEADCRLCFFLQKYNGEWKNHFFKGFYEKDKAIPVDPRKVPVFDDAKLASFPEGYRMQNNSITDRFADVLTAGYLAYGQSAAYKIKMDLPQNHGDEHDHFYESFVSWLEGSSIDEMKVTLGV